MSATNQKVIIVGPAFPLRGGIANFNEALCRAMGKAGKDSKIISFSLQYPNFLFPGKTQFDSGKGPKDIAIETRINSINPFTWWSVARKIKKEKPDYVIIRYWLPFMGPCLGTIARLVKWGTNIKVIAITDNVIPHEKRIGDSLFTKYFVRSCHGFVAMSQAVLDDLNVFTNSSNKAFLPHPIYDIFGDKQERMSSLRHLNLDLDKKYILFFGFIRKYKGLDLLLEAMADERIKQLGIKLIVAGEFYEDPEPYKQLIENKGISDRVVLRTEYIESEEVKH